MKNLIKNIEGVNFMNDNEMLNTFGGGWWSDFKDGFNAGWKWAIKAIQDVKEAAKQILL
ncbi:hypothetical protein V7S76_00745 [Aquirufa sp. ROCK2-A2]